MSSTKAVYAGKKLGGVGVVLGAGFIGDPKDPFVHFGDVQTAEQFLQIFYDRGYKTLDTARSYPPGAPGTCEPILGKINNDGRFTIHTKALFSGPGSLAKDKLEKDIPISLESLNVSKLDLEYLHVPDTATPIEETCETLNTAYRQGQLSHWGLSNYSVKATKEVLQLCEENGWLKPAVYQGQYNVVIRGAEDELFPLLRKHNVAFYAYSPAAGGFFRSREDREGKGKRFDKSTMVGGLYQTIYYTDALLKFVDQFRALATSHNLNPHEVSLRWSVHHSKLSEVHGDAIIVGANSDAQLTTNLDALEAGPLPDELASKIEAMFEEIREVTAPQPAVQATLNTVRSKI